MHLIHLLNQASTDTNSFQTDSNPTLASGGSGTTSCPDTISRLWIPDSNVGGDRSLVTKVRVHFLLIMSFITVRRQRFTVQQ